jgi:hypothetical protein
MGYLRNLPSFRNPARARATRHPHFAPEVPANGLGGVLGENTVVGTLVGISSKLRGPESLGEVACTHGDRCSVGPRSLFPSHVDHAIDGLASSRRFFRTAYDCAPFAVFGPEGPAHPRTRQKMWANARLVGHVQPSIRFSMLTSVNSLRRCEALQMPAGTTPLAGVRDSPWTRCACPLPKRAESA